MQKQNFNADDFSKGMKMRENNVRSKELNRAER